MTLFNKLTPDTIGQFLAAYRSGIVFDATSATYEEMLVHLASSHRRESDLIARVAALETAAGSNTNDELLARILALEGSPKPVVTKEQWDATWDELVSPQP